MARILSDLPLFSLIQVSPYLYEKILEKMREEFPLLMSKIRRARIENLTEMANTLGVVFVPPKRSRSVAIAISVINIVTTPKSGTVTVEITLPQLYGKAVLVAAVTEVFLGITDKYRANEGVKLGIILNGDDAPVLTGQHGNNGHAQRFYAARREIAKIM